MRRTEDGAPAMIDAAEFDRLFDEGEMDVDQYFDIENVQYPGLETHTGAVDLPASVLDALERESAKNGTRISDLI